MATLTLDLKCKGLTDTIGSVGSKEIFSGSATIKSVFYPYLYVEIQYGLYGFLKQLDGTITQKLVTMGFVVFVVSMCVGCCVVVAAHVYVLWKVCKEGVGGGDSDVPTIQRRSSSTKSTNMWKEDDLKKIPCFEYEAEERGEASGGSPDPCAVCLEGFKVG
ncbi:hypothetical protein Acr_06g0012470 [Actinidia rufa]|uniref:Uncharacterized protein n=1 Tax=Actinidia rufa TaxID=165716 RepID=A0A7J0EUQ0_9ERIC|nr:hypothetical protein Acr_06g0012470 [Actinidia rufa]